MVTPDSPAGLTQVAQFIKRLFDLVFACSALLALWWIMVLAWLAASLDTGTNGFFVQERIGRFGRSFNVIKLRTMKSVDGYTSSVTIAGDPRVTAVGRFLRRTKIDELPQLINVILGDMSTVGPRPDVAGFADKLSGADRVILTVRPGITGPASLKYRDEESLLAAHPCPEKFNRETLFPEKVRINREYIENYSFRDDLKYIFKTILG